MNICDRHKAVGAVGSMFRLVCGGLAGRRWAALGFLALAGLGQVGCGSRRPSPDSWRVGLNREFFDISVIEASFAGLYVDADVVVLLGVDASRESAVRAAVSGLLERNQLSASETRFVSCRYSWIELDSAATGALSRCFDSGIAEIDIDERQNRVVLGASTGRLDSVRRCLVDQEFDVDAFLVRKFLEVETR